MRTSWVPKDGHMPALAFQQPWLWLILKGYKKAYKEDTDQLENRDQYYSYRGPLLLHASKTFDQQGDRGDGFILWSQYQRMGCPTSMPRRIEEYSHGGIVGVADLVDVVPASESPWFVGRYGLILRNVQPLNFVGYRGELGLFSVPLSVFHPTVVVSCGDVRCVARLYLAYIAYCEANKIAHQRQGAVSSLMKGEISE